MIHFNKSPREQNGVLGAGRSAAGLDPAGAAQDRGAGTAALVLVSRLGRWAGGDGAAGFAGATTSGGAAVNRELLAAVRAELGAGQAAALVLGVVAAAAGTITIGNDVILLHPPSIWLVCFHRTAERVPAD